MLFRSAIANNIVFRYNNTNEGTVYGSGTSVYNAGNMKAQRWAQKAGGSWGWNDPTLWTQSDALAAPIAAVTTAANDSINDGSWVIWTITNQLSNNGPLPVELISFNAKQIDKKVKIWWDVQSEMNVSKYYVERTKDYSYMDEVASQLPVGPATMTLHYETWDESPLKGMSYYRLKTLSTDGNAQYSQFVPVNFEGKSLFQITNVAANADAGTVTVNFIYDAAGPYNYIVTDVTGKVIAKGDAIASSGLNQIQIPATISTGIYIISIRNQTEAVTEKFRF